MATTSGPSNSCRTSSARALQAALLAGFALAAVPGAARADVVTDWNDTAIKATAGTSAAGQSRILAIAHAAMYDAARAFDSHRAAYVVDVRAPTGASIEAAVAAAAHGTLIKLMPGQSTMLDGALKTTLDSIGDAKAKADGAGVGQQVAEKILDIRSKDQASVNLKADMHSGPGKYEVTPPHKLPVVLAGWAKVTPFAIKDASGFVLKGPPAPNSAEFARDFNEVKAIGARNSKTRTADQTAAAIFWIVQTSIPFNAAARAAAIKKGDGIINNARLFALLNAASSDSQVACYAEKNKWHHWRPITAIRNAAQAKVAALQADPNWEPLIGTPPHQEYPSAHSCLSGAAETVLKVYFDSDQIGVNVDVTSPPVLGVTRTYARFSQISDENEEARIWGGIHFRSADVDGRLLGKMVAQEVLRTFPGAGTTSAAR